MNALAGTWSYRSFINNPDPVSTPDQALNLIFGEGELMITHANPADGFRATLSFGGDAVMDLAGTVAEAQGTQPLTATVKGRGRPRGPIADFAYDYSFYAVPAWPDGIDQRPALVGSVVRVADHGGAKKGATASTITLKRDA